MPRNDKNAFLSPHCVWRPIATQPPRVSSSVLYRLKVDSVGYIFALIVCVYLLSHFRGGRIDPSRSSEVDDFRVIWKGSCDFLLVINSNLSSISHRFWYDDLSVENRQFSLPHLRSAPNLKMFGLHWIAEILRTASEDIVLINRVIKFHLAQRMWSQSINVTDRQTDRQTDAIWRQYRSIAIAWSGKNCSVYNHTVMVT